MDLRGLMKYARDKGVKVEQLSEDEKMLFVRKADKQAVTR
jgi:hypothetical protein